MSQRDSIQFLQRQAASLLLYQAVMQEPVAQAFLQLLYALQQEDELVGLRAYGQWFQTLVFTGCSWPEYLLLQLLRADNPFATQLQKASAAGISEVAAVLTPAVEQDLRILQQLYHCEAGLYPLIQQKLQLNSVPIAGGQFNPAIAELKQLPLWSQFEQSSDWADLVPELTEYYRQFGTGLFASYRAFRWQADDFVGISIPDPIGLEQLAGYETQKALLQQNTEALIAGYPALHVLLYGSRGSGKSSLVKALLSTYYQQGLRVIEVGKSELQHLPLIVDRVRDLPQKFIVFVDDLSFEADDEAYKALKVVLEGSITARPSNLVVYATSNRRHLIREFFADRPRPSDADEVHNWDTVQEKLSFSDRFGLTLTFEPADQTTYLTIVQHLAQQATIALSREALEFRALQWATRHNGRSGRTARQFIDFLQAEQAKLT